MSIKAILDEIANESSTNKKMDILKKYSEDLVLQKVLYLAYSKRIKFYVKQIPIYETYDIPATTLENALNNLEKLSNRELTGHAGINFLFNLLSVLSADDAIIIERIIGKDLKIGMANKNISKVIPNLLEVTGYCGAKGYDDKLVDNIIKSNKINFSQEKLDGRYVNVIVIGGEVEMTSRQGEPTILTGAKFLSELKEFDDCVLNGELTMESLDRYTSNGIIASLIDINKKREERSIEETNKKIEAFEKKHMKFEDALNLVKFTAWDILSIDEFFTLKSETPYYERFKILNDMIGKYNTNMVSIVETKLVTSKAEIINHFEEILSRNGEGTILKSYDGKWKNGKPVTSIKLKKEIELDLKIVGFNMGTGKNIDVVSSLNCESEDGLLKTSPTGISEEDMLDITQRQEELLGTIVAVKCSGISQDSNGNYSLLHPVYKGLRIGEKSIANTLVECIEINKSSQFQ